MPIVAVIWQYRTQIMYAVLISLAAFVIWWFGFHIPKVNEQRRQEIIELNRQIEARDSAINLLGVIGSDHARIEREYEENLRRLRKWKPTRTGVFVMSGMLPPLFEAYSSSGGAASSNDTGAVQP